MTNVVTTFEILEYLPVKDQQEIARIQAIDSTLRNDEDAAFLVSRAAYLTNKLITVDPSTNLILEAAGNTLPTGKTGFKKGARFIKLDAAANGFYSNTGDETSATWNLVDQADTSDIPDNAVTTAKILDANVTAAKLAATLDLTGHTLNNYQVQSGTPVNAVASTQTLTLTGVITPGSHAETVLTSDATNVADGEVAVIGDITYRFKDTMLAAYDVKIGADAATTLDNLKAAINASGTEGVEYFAGTLAHPTVVATDNAATTQKIVARVPGTAANAAATTTTAAHLSWQDTTLGGGTGTSNPGVAPETVTIDSVVYSIVDVLSETNAPAAAIANQVLFGASSAEALDNLKLAINHGATEGTQYSTGTVVHPTVTATTNSNTEQVVEAKTKGVAGDAITVATDFANGAWGDTVLAGGVNGTVGLIRQLMADASYLYMAIAANTIADANWRRFTVGSAY